jgi:hypothetical protein
MEPWVLSTEELHLHNFRRSPKDEKWSQNDAAFADLQVGDMIIHNICFVEDSSARFGFCQDWQYIRPRVYGSRLWQRFYPGISDPLEDVLSAAICDFIIEEGTQEIRSFILGESANLEFPSFRPIGWEGKRMTVYFNSVSASHFACLLMRPEILTCNLRLDGHLTYFEVPIYDGKTWSFTETGVPEQARDAALRLLKNESLRHYVKGLYRQNALLDPDFRKFVLCAQGYDPEGPYSSISLV